MISIVTSLFRSDSYLDKYQKNLVFFVDYLLKKNIDFEIIIIANDPTKKEITFAEFFKNRSWFTFVSVPRETLYASWNRGVRISKGNFIGFWNVDDVRRPEAIVKAVELFDEGAQVVNFPFVVRWYIKFFGYHLLVKWKKIIPPAFDRIEFTRSMHCGPFFIFSKETYKNVGQFDEQFKIVADFDWCIRAAKFTDKFYLAKEPAGVFRVDGKGLSSGGKPIHQAENNIVYKRYGVEDKIVVGYEDLEQQYCVDKIKVDGQYNKFIF